MLLSDTKTIQKLNILLFAELLPVSVRQSGIGDLKTRVMVFAPKHFTHQAPRASGIVFSSNCKYRS